MSQYDSKAVTHYKFSGMQICDTFDLGCQQDDFGNQNFYKNKSFESLTHTRLVKAESKLNARMKPSNFLCIPGRKCSIQSRCLRKLIVKLA